MRYGAILFFVFYSLSSFADEKLYAHSLKLDMGLVHRIVRGKISDPTEYPASFRAGNIGRRCTWCLVGPGTLVGAAHFLAGEEKEDPLPKIEFKIESVIYTANCEISSSFWKDPSADWALCLVTPSAPIPLSNDGKYGGFELVSTQADDLSGFPILEITGYGCSYPDGPVEEDYLIGTARVEELPPNARVLHVLKPTPNAIKLRKAPNFLCGGDSGGPAFLYRKFNDRLHRVVVGINSSTVPGSGISFLSSLSTTEATSFIKDWAAKNDQKICGIHADASGCRPYLP